MYVPSLSMPPFFTKKVAPMATATTTREPTMMGVLVSLLAIVAGGVLVVKLCRVRVNSVYMCVGKRRRGANMAGLVAKGSGTKRLDPQLVGGCAAQRIGMQVDKAVPECMQSCRRGELLKCPAPRLIRGHAARIGMTQAQKESTEILCVGRNDRRAMPKAALG